MQAVLVVHGLNTFTQHSAYCTPSGQARAKACADINTLHRVRKLSSMDYFPTSRPRAESTCAAQVNLLANCIDCDKAQHKQRYSPPIIAVAFCSIRRLNIDQQDDGSCRKQAIHQPRLPSHDGRWRGSYVYVGMEVVQPARIRKRGMPGERRRDPESGNDTSQQPRRCLIRG